MEYIKMAEDLEFSRIVLGFWRILDWKMDTDQLVKYINECKELGITTTDHANIYANGIEEELFGKAVKRDPSIPKGMQIVTKCGIVFESPASRVKHYDYTDTHIVEQANLSLKKMGVDHIDLLLLHRPSPIVDPEAVAKAFDKLHQSGKVRYFGVSNHLPYQFETLKSFLNVPLITNQVELSPLNMENIENGTIDQCMRERIHPMIWSPLAGGRIFTGEDEVERRLRETLEEIRIELGANDIGEIVFSWLLTHPAGLLPITGTGDLKHLKIPVNALQYKLTPEQWFMIWTAAKGHEVP